MDTDDPDHIQWLFDVASKRAKEFGIEGVTWSSTQGVVKNIIPGTLLTFSTISLTSFLLCLQLSQAPTLSLQVGSSSSLMLNANTVIASCCNEAFKIATSSAPYLDNYMWVPV